ncbi:hypothetical protein [Spiroplasma sp. DGKH1]|uniref:hypothetical protein n=1 Tax=Spiroplasma sp. DGKH1 TaxID=3050074 RepID=UPI0034C6A033
MIFINDQSQKYQATLKFLGKEDPQYNNIFVDKTPGAISFLDSTHTFYLAGKLSDPDCYQTMRASLKKFIQRNNFNLLVDIDSFTLDNIEIISAIIEAILEATHPAWTMRSNVQPKTEHYLLKTSYPEIDSLYQRLLAEITSVNLARDLQDGAPNIIYPAAFVDIITNKYHPLKNLKISVLNLEDIKKLKMGLFLSVNQGSVDEGKILIVEYHNDPTTTEKTAFIGKGITFDSGGYVLKPPSGMVNMRYDMSGAASVISAMYGVSQLAPKINVVALAPLTDNRIGGGNYS